MTITKYLNTIKLVMRDCDPWHSAELAAYFTELHDKIAYARSGLTSVLCNLEEDHPARAEAEDAQIAMAEAAHYAAIMMMARSVVGSDNSFMN